MFRHIGGMKDDLNSLLSPAPVKEVGSMTNVDDGFYNYYFGLNLLILGNNLPLSATHMSPQKSKVF